MTASALDTLEPIIAPTSVSVLPFDSSTSVSIWPLAPAWWVVIALTVIVILAGCAYWRLVYKHNQAKREAIILASTLNNEGAEHLQQLNMILKRLAAHYYGADKASCHSQQWCDFIHSACRVTITNDQLTHIYHPKVEHSHYTQVKQLLSQAIKRFNTRGAAHV